MPGSPCRATVIFTKKGELLDAFGTYWTSWKTYPTKDKSQPVLQPVLSGGEFSNLPKRGLIKNLSRGRQAGSAVAGLGQAKGEAGAGGDDRGPHNKDRPEPERVDSNTHQR